MLRLDATVTYKVQFGHSLRTLSGAPFATVLDDPVLGKVRVHAETHSDEMLVELVFAYPEHEIEEEGVRELCASLVARFRDALVVAVGRLTQLRAAHDNISLARLRRDASRNPPGAGEVRLPTLRSEAHVPDGHEVRRCRSVAFDEHAQAYCRDVLRKANAPEQMLMLFSAVDSTEDNIARYVILYGMLTNLAHGRKKQSDVDALVLAHAPSTPASLAPKKQRSETVYTRLRNDLMHSEDRPRRPSELRQEIDQWVNRLENLVRCIVIARHFV